MSSTPGNATSFVRLFRKMSSRQKKKKTAKEFQRFLTRDELERTSRCGLFGTQASVCVETTLLPGTKRCTTGYTRHRCGKRFFFFFFLSYIVLGHCTSDNEHDNGRSTVLMNRDVNRNRGLSKPPMDLSASGSISATFVYYTTLTCARARGIGISVRRISNRIQSIRFEPSTNTDNYFHRLEPSRPPIRLLALSSLSSPPII